MAEAEEEAFWITHGALRRSFWLGSLQTSSAGGVAAIKLGSHSYLSLAVEYFTCCPQRAIFEMLCVVVLTGRAQNLGSLLLGGARKRGL